MKNYYFIPLLLLLWACDPFDTKIEENQVYTYKAKNITLYDIPSQLVIADWNIKFGGGRLNFFFDCHGNHSIMKKEEVEKHLEQIISKINQVNPDILFLQEVDILSKRSAYINQVQWILDNSKLNYAVYASQWQADYIPSDGIGRVNSGNVILSKFPLKNHERVALPLIEDQSALVKYFYLRRNILKTQVNIGSENIYLFNTHITAYADNEEKKRQIDILKNKLNDINSLGYHFVAGGDLNTLPPHSVKTKDFKDTGCNNSEEDNYTGEEHFLTELYEKYTPAISLQKYKEDNSLCFTHSISKDIFWNRKIDYLFTNANFVENSEMTHQEEKSGEMEMMSRSDHAMLSVKFEL